MNIWFFLLKKNEFKNNLYIYNPIDNADMSNEKG